METKYHFCFFFQRRERVEREVNRLREEISVKKTAGTTATKGIPANKTFREFNDLRKEYRARVVRVV